MNKGLENSSQTKTLSLEDLSYLGTLISLIVAFLAFIFPESKNLWNLGYRWAAITLTTFVLTSIFLLIALIEPKREENLKWIKNQSWSKGYNFTLRYFLDKIDHIFSKNINNKENPIIFYWPAKQLGITLILASIYPITSIIIQWIVSGQHISLGNFQVFNDINSAFDRVIIVFIFCLFIVFSYIYKKKKNYLAAISSAYSIIIIISFALTGEWKSSLELIVGIIAFILSFTLIKYLFKIPYKVKPHENTVLFISLIVSGTISVSATAFYVASDADGAIIQSLLSISVIIAISFTLFSSEFFDTKADDLIPIFGISIITSIAIISIMATIDIFLASFLCSISTGFAVSWITRTRASFRYVHTIKYKQPKNNFEKISTTIFSKNSIKQRDEISQQKNPVVQKILALKFSTVSSHALSYLESLGVTFKKRQSTKSEDERVLIFQMLMLCFLIFIFLVLVVYSSPAYTISEGRDGGEIKTEYLKSLTSEKGRIILIFLGFLPLLNAFFDFLSIGLTRVLLRKSLKSRTPFLYSFFDLIGGILIFLALKLSLIYILTTISFSNGIDIIDFKGKTGLFKGIKSMPDSYLWLVFTLFSTLIPTILHLNIACFSIAALRVKPLKLFLLKTPTIFKHPSKTGWLKTTFSFLLLSAIISFFILAPVSILFSLWSFLVGNHIKILIFSQEIAENWHNYLILK